MRHRPSCRSRAMHVPRELYPIERALAEHLPHLRGPQRRGLALWVLGAVLAQSACQAAVLAALLPWAPYHALRQRLREWLLDGAGKAWVGRGRLGRRKGRRLTVTLVAVWTAAQEEPWVVVTDLPPDRVGVSWYALRAWVELGFRALQGLGWQWQRSRRTEPARVARHWLVLAVASLTALAPGTRVEDARERGLPPVRLRAPPASRAGTRPRRICLVRLVFQLRRHLLVRGRLWRRLRLARAHSP